MEKGKKEEEDEKGEAREEGIGGKLNRFVYYR